MISFIIAVGQWLWGFLEWLVESIEAWFFTRRWELAIGGIPACLVTVVLLFILIGQQTKPAVAVAEPYRQAFADAILAKDFDRADLALKKLIDLQVADGHSRFQFALLAESAGEAEAVWEQIWELAPDDRVGYPPAHLWVARHELHRQPSWSAEDRDRCLHHLNAAKTDPNLLPQASELLGLLHFFSRDFAAAAQELKSIPDPTVNGRIALAVAYQMAGQPEDSRAAWSQVVPIAEGLLKNAPDRVDLRLLLAVACSHSLKHDQAVQVLRNGLHRPATATDRRLQEALGLALVQRLNSTTRLPENTTDREELLQELLSVAATSTTVASKLIRWQPSDAREAQRIHDELSRRSEVGSTTTVLNSVLGTASAEALQLADARARLERASQQNPKNPAILNNLAWVLAHSQPPELDRALELANSAVQTLPEDADFRETRGQILLQLGKWQAAIADLEWTVSRIKPQSLSAVHSGLEKAYSELGNTARATHHREQSQAWAAAARN